MSQGTFVSYAQNGEDILLWRALKHVEHGFYIDVGAQDPIVESVTKGFYEKGWRGINLEPVEHWYGRLIEDRPHDINLRVAASNRPGTMTLFEVEGTGLSTADPEFARRHQRAGRIIREQAVETRTLDAICDEHHVGVVHFLKIDCEGAERTVLEGLSLTVVRPWVILLEATEPNTETPAWQQWDPLLTGRGYRFVFFDGLNRYYVATEHAELAAAFNAPVNVFDAMGGVQRISDIQVREEMRQLHGMVDALTSASAIAALQVQIAGVAAERDRIAAAHAAVAAERDRFANERDNVMAERDGVMAERDGVMAERDGVMAERDQALLTCARLQRETVGKKVELQRAQDALAAVKRSMSWRITAPLRAVSVGARWIGRGVCRMLYWVLRPFARLARPLLRRLAAVGWLRKMAVAVFGTESRLTGMARLFLFGANSPASRAVVSQGVAVGGWPAAIGNAEVDGVMDRVRARAESLAKR